MTKTATEKDGATEFIRAYPRVAKALEPYGRLTTELALSFPRLMSTIENGWGTSDCFTYINSLLFSDRAGRQGFSAGIVDEILFLKNVFEISFPRLTGNPFDPFSNLRASEIGERIKESKKALADAAQAPVQVSSDRAGKGRRTSNNRLPETSTIAELTAQLLKLERGEIPSGKNRKLIGEYLLDAGVLDHSTLTKALDFQSKAPVHHLIGECLLVDGAIEKQQVNWALSVQRGVPVVDAASIEVSSEAIRLVPIRIARLKAAMPIAMIDRRLVVAVTDPFDVELQEYFSFLSGTRAILVFSMAEKIEIAQGTYAQGGGKQGGLRQYDESFRASPLAVGKKIGVGRPLYEPLADEFAEEDDDSQETAEVASVDENDETVIGLVNKVINDAIRVGASDVHFEAFSRTKNAQIRFRKDGQMEAHTSYPLAYHPAVVSRIKIIAELDISERRKSQDGKISFGQGSRRLDLRVSTIPTTNSLEMVTIRILSSGKPLPMSKLGMHPEMLSAFRDEVFKPYGLILVCGPTGSGKTTTLHSVLRELNTPDRKIWTAEDPVEVVQKNISQVQVLPKIGWTFANALRAFLRADPDVIMIGEIRDSETAKVAVEASMTGHMVMSTLHTNSAAETLARLIDLEIAPFNLADSVLAVLAQRLARRICNDCGEEHEFGAEELETLVDEYHYASVGKAASKAERDKLLSKWRSEFTSGRPLSGRRAIGCATCNGTGYRGRLGLHELMVATSEIKRLIRGRASTGEIFRQAMADGMKTLRQDGIEKVAQGLTDLKEVRAVCL